MNNIHIYVCIKLFKTLPSLKTFALASRNSHYTNCSQPPNKDLATFLGGKLSYRDGKHCALTDQGKSYALPINHSFDQMFYSTKLLGQDIN